MKLMKQLSILYLILICTSGQVFSQNNLHMQNPVSFINDYPHIDGSPDSQLTRMPIRKFDADILKSRVENPEHPINYRLGYGTDFLYLYIEVEADSVIIREDGYRNGDGFIMSLSVPQFDNNPTEEFINLGFYPTSDIQNPVKRIIWQYNNAYVSEIPGESCKFAISQYQGKTGYELLLPWKDVYPYHPWFSEQIGFNLFFVKAIAGNERNIHGVVIDDRLTLDQNLLKYTRLVFEKPGPDTCLQSYLMMDRNSYEGESVETRFVTRAQKGLKEKIQISIVDKAGELRSTEIVEYETADVLTHQNFDLKVYDQPSGDYRVEWRSLSGAASGYVELTVLPYIFFDEIYDRLTEIKDNVSDGSYITLNFLLDDLHERSDRMKSYDYAPDLRKEFIQLLEMIDAAGKKVDGISEKRGILRRAYRMGFSQELWPYSVYIPENYDQSRRYPLLVFLHDQDQDDRALADHLFYLKCDDCILLAPNGRGLRNCYTVKEAQIDIQQAIEDVSTNYSVDRTKMILAGFSMGGYGVYRTHYEYPEDFKGLAIFSGQPDLASHYFPAAGHPNFLNDEILALFKNIPLFIYHGKKDQTSPYELTEEVVTKLIVTGAHVEFVIGENNGHSPPERGDAALFHQWITKILK